MATAITQSWEDKGTTSGTGSAEPGRLESVEAGGPDGVSLEMPAAHVNTSWGSATLEAISEA